MIKIGCNYLSLPDMDIETFIRTAYELRLDVVDFNIRAFKSRDPGYLRATKIQCLKQGLPISYIGISAGFVGDEEELGKRVVEAEDAIDVAAFLGAPLIRVFGGHVPAETEDWEPLYEDLVGCLKTVCDYGAGKGVIVALQNHDGGNLAATDDDVLRILHDTGHPNFSLIMDTGQWKGGVGAHPVGESDPNIDIYDYMEGTIGHAEYVRAKIYRIESGREELLDYERITGILDRAGYNGCLSIVYEGAEEERVGAVRKAAAHLREMLGSL